MKKIFALLVLGFALLASAAPVYADPAAAASWLMVAAAPAALCWTSSPSHADHRFR
jgi:hypothetical protein